VDGTSGDVEPLWRSRLRWRLKGATLWPAFVVMTLVEAIVLGRLPIAGDGGTAFVPGFLLAGFFNLLAVGVVGPLLAYWLRHRRRRRLALPRVVAEDYTGTVMLGVVFAGLLAGGTVHHGRLEEAERDMAAQASSARRFIAHRAPPAFRERVDQATTIKLEDDLFRTCAPGPDPDRWYCVVVKTDESPPGVTVDPNRESNASLRTAGGFR
jgi:hypothetical protein